MPDHDNQLRIDLSITLSTEALAAARDAGSGAHAVVTFAHEDDDLQCDAEISLRLTIKR